ncbi:MAG: SDR family oxidoreductase [Myxococcales bacterium]|nr:SDR family oxidoreductase [Myxococcales bacterium]
MSREPGRCILSLVKGRSPVNLIEDYAAPPPWTPATALITGASRGLGRALALALARRGVRVALVARGEAALADVVAEIEAAGGEAHALVADLSAPGIAHAVAGQAAARLGPVELLINNASELGPTPLSLLVDGEPDALTRVLMTNLVAPFDLTRVLVGSMLLRERGVVVNISSDAAVEAYPEWGFYSASKAALDHLTRIWAAELGDAGVRLFSVDPGEMNTAMHAAALPDADPATLADPNEIAARIVEMILDPARAPSGSRQVAPRWREEAAGAA